MSDLAEALQRWRDKDETVVFAPGPMTTILNAASKWERLLCPTCHGEGNIIYGMPKSCPVCGGDGYNPEIVERGAKAIYDRDDAYEMKWEHATEGVKDWYRDKAIGMLDALREEPE